MSEGNGPGPTHKKVKQDLAGADSQLIPAVTEATTLGIEKELVRGYIATQSGGMAVLEPSTPDDDCGAKQ